MLNTKKIFVFISVLRFPAIVQQVVGDLLQWLYQRFYIAKCEDERGKSDLNALQRILVNWFQSICGHVQIVCFANAFPFCPLSIIGYMCFELYGKVPENEPAYFTTFPGIPNHSQWKCHIDGSERRWQIEAKRHCVILTSAFGLLFCVLLKNKSLIETVAICLVVFLMGETGREMEEMSTFVVETW